jgi:hypothetical protein
VLALQRAAGNRATVAVLARRTTIVDNPADPTTGGAGIAQLATNVGRADQGIHPTVAFGPLINGCASAMSALIVPPVDDLGGSEPQKATWPPWWEPNKPRSPHWWVRGHLLNDNLGGPGEPRNLTPITKKCNSQHHTLVERLLKKAAANDWVLGYDVVPEYDVAGLPLEADRKKNPDPSVWPNLATTLECEWVFHDGEAELQGEGRVSIPNTHEG